MNLKQRIEFALRMNVRILTTPTLLLAGKTEGFTPEEMMSYGLSEADLKKLERYGMSMRVYMPIPFVGKQTRRTYKRGKFKKRHTFPLGEKHAGFQKRWTLLAEDKEVVHG